MQKILKLNTSNLGKFEEFKHFFKQFGLDLEVTHIDLKEIDADPVDVITHKASHIGENILVEDTSLHVEGMDIGVNVKWLLTHLNECLGRRAEWVVLLGVRKGDQVFIYRGITIGHIVAPKGSSGFGFDPFFFPDGATKALAEEKLEVNSARKKAVEAFVNGSTWTTRPLITTWEGPYQ